MNVIALIKSDVAASAYTDSPKLGDWMRHLLTLRGQSTVIYRLAHYAGGIHPFLGLLLKQWNQFLTGASISWPAQIGPGLILYHPGNVTLGANVVIGRDARLQQDINVSGFGGAMTRDYENVPSPVLGDGVLVGAGARVLGALRIGDGAKIGANAVVLCDVPAGATAVGVPARVILPRSRS